MKYLLDTNVISELIKPRPQTRVLEWFSSVADEDLYLSVVTVGELRAGIEGKLASGDRRAAVRLDSWLRGLQSQYSERIVPIDLETAEEWGKMMALDRNYAIDALLAATAKRHGLTLVTRNVKHVASRPVVTYNPFGA